MSSNLPYNILVIRDHVVGEGQVSADTVEREEGGARGNQESSQKETRVAVSVEGIGGGHVEGEKKVVENAKDGGLLVGPSGLDFLVHNLEVEGYVEGDGLEEGVGLVSSGPAQFAEVDKTVGSDDVGGLADLGGPANLHCQLSSTSSQINAEAPLCGDGAISIVVNKQKTVDSNLSESQSQNGVAIDSNAQVVKKLGNRSKFPQGCGPKFLQLVEAVKDGGVGGRRRRARGGGSVGRSSSVPAVEGERGRTSVGVLSPSEAVNEAPPLISSQIMREREQNIVDQ
jgi:hypothetical protein